MNGQNSNNPEIGRRAFFRYTLGLFAALGAVGFLLSRKKETPKITITEESPDATKGHLLRQPGALDQLPKGGTRYTEVAIVGGGVAGLSAGRFLSQAGIKDYTILEMEKAAGGNAAASAQGKNKYPLGAHYLTIPNAHNQPLVQFLTECGMVRENVNGKIHYQEEYIVHTPAEHCYYQGRWHKGLIPEAYLDAEEKKQLAAFEALTNQYSNETLLNIPFDAKILTPELLALDQVTFLQFLKDHHITAANVLAYVDYCCRDDFGGGAEHVSALAGLHYFCSRRAHFSNPAEVDFLSWPQGNGFLVEQLLKQNTGTISTDALVTSITKKESLFEITYLKDEQLHTLNAKYVVLDTPHFVNERMVRCEGFDAVPKALQVYYPWAIVNVVLSNASGIYTNAFHWDNVVFGSDSLGFINSSHQLLEQGHDKTVLTFYKAFKGEQHAERGKLYQTSKETLAEMALEEIEKGYPGIRAHVETVSVCRRGHGMICPVPGMFTHLHQKDLRNTGVENLYRIHTDVSGYSVFEEAFANAHTVAMDIKNKTSA